MVSQHSMYTLACLPSWTMSSLRTGTIFYFILLCSPRARLLHKCWLEGMNECVCVYPLHCVGDLDPDLSLPPHTMGSPREE